MTLHADCTCPWWGRCRDCPIHGDPPLKVQTYHDPYVIQFPPCSSCGAIYGPPVIGTIHYPDCRAGMPPVTDPGEIPMP